MLKETGSKSCLEAVCGWERGTRVPVEDSAEGEHADCPGLRRRRALQPLEKGRRKRHLPAKGRRWFS